MDTTLKKVSDIQIDKKLAMMQLLGQRVANYQNNIERLDNNLPLAYIDPQVIVEHLTEEELIQQEIDQATIAIDYLEGFPVVNGLPFWERLDCEPLDYYKLFKIYRNQKNTDSTRSFEKLIEQTTTKIGYLYALSKIYHWQDRCKAFDLFNSFLIDKERSKAIKIMEGKHKKTAEKMWELCEKYLTELEDKPDKLLNFKPAEFKSLLVEARKLERLSLGLSGDRPPAQPTTIEKTTINVDSKTMVDNKTISIPSGDKIEYLQEIVDVLHKAKALPKTLEAQGDLREEIIIDEQGEENEERSY